RSIPRSFGDRSIVRVTLQQQVPERPQQTCLRRERAVDGLQGHTRFGRDVFDGRARVAVAFEQPLGGFQDRKASGLCLLLPALGVVRALGASLDHLTTLTRY